MKASSIRLAAAATLVLATCASTPEKVPVAGSPGSLNGSWHGEFNSESTNRSGTIHFNLLAGQDSATGDVLMVSQEWSNRGSRYWETNPPNIQQPTLLRINFVNISDTMIRGTMEPYHDDLCDCTVKLVFEGVVAWDVIEGMYQARYSTGALAFEGTWRVNRVDQLN